MSTDTHSRTALAFRLLHIEALRMFTEGPRPAESRTAFVNRLRETCGDDVHAYVIHQIQEGFYPATSDPRWPGWVEIAILDIQREGLPRTITRYACGHRLPEGGTCGLVRGHGGQHAPAERPFA